MKYQIFSQNDWIYPDSEITGCGEAKLYSARGADVCFQVLTDTVLSGGEKFSAEAEGIGAEAFYYQLLPSHVSKNSGAQYETAKDYDEVRCFVTRKAPFDVYDITKSIDDGTLKEGRAAFFIRFNVGKDAVPGVYDGKITLTVGNDKAEIPVSLKIYNTQIPEMGENFRCVNWLYYDGFYSTWEAFHGVKEWTEEYYAILEKYIQSEVELRTDILMLPAPVPVRDENGKVIDLDLTHAARVAQIALKNGMKIVAGKHCVTWKQWDKPEMYIEWDDETEATSIEGYRQLIMYFDKIKEFIRDNDLEGKYMQCLCDEPQFQNAAAYRAVGAICRKHLPGITIFDACETTDIGGALDIWVVKQATFEKYLEDFKTLQDMGEKMWIYSCGYPAGYYMNHVLDLPLTATRLIIWMCYKYNAPGFLHFGYHLHNKERWGDANFEASGGRRFPAGNSFIVYPWEDGVQFSVRAHAQRDGQVDFELFNMLAKKNKAEADRICDIMCRSFRDYDASGEKLDAARHELLELLG